VGRHLVTSTPSQPDSRLRVDTGRPRNRARLPLAVFAFLAVCGFLLVNLVDPSSSSTSWAYYRAPQLAAGPSQNFVTDGAVQNRVERDGFSVKDKVPAPVAVTDSSAAPAAAAPSPGSAQAIAREMVLARGWAEGEFSCLVSLWMKESRWNVSAENSSSGAYGIPQALPGSKMASTGSDWRTNPATQIQWGIGYIVGRYGSPCGAWAHSQAKNWY